MEVWRLMYFYTLFQLQLDQTSQVFLMRPRLIIGPHTSEDHKIIFAPRKPGVYEAKIQVGSSPVVADSEMGLLRVTAPHMMSVRAVAELSELEVGWLQLLNQIVHCIMFTISVPHAQYCVVILWSFYFLVLSVLKSLRRP